MTTFLDMLGAAEQRNQSLLCVGLDPDITRLPELARLPATALHLYGKAEARPGRKMGHVNRILPRR